MGCDKLIDKMYRKSERNVLCLCSYLLPSILLLSYQVNKISQRETYFVAIQLTINNIIYSTFFKLGYNSRNSYQNLIFKVTISVIQTWFFGINHINTFITILSHSLFIDQFFRFVPKWFKLSFTKSELIIIGQGLSIVIFQCLRCFISIFISNSISCSKYLPTKIVTILYTGCTIILSLSYALRQSTRLNPIIREYSSMTIGMLVTYISLFNTISSEPIIWLFEFLFKSDKSIYLMRIWTACLIGCIGFAFLFARYSTQNANTVCRKVYHIAILIIFLTGAKYDLNLLYFTSSAALIIFILLENIRINRLPPFGQTIDQIFKQFIDEKDAGILTLTHIYLLIGFSLPIWIVHDLKSDLIFASGLITIGIGDTMASFVGYMFGRHKWNNSMKTYEGTCAAILSQILGGLFFLYYINLSINRVIVCKLIFLSTVIGLIEAKTIQIDNLILPLYFHLIMLILDFIV